MPLTEDRRSDNRVSLTEREQIFTPGDKAVGLCRAQGSQHQLIGLIAQGFIRWSYDFPNPAAALSSSASQFFG
jgi:hypothetical protein